MRRTVAGLYALSQTGGGTVPSREEWHCPPAVCAHPKKGVVRFSLTPVGAAPESSRRGSERPRAEPPRGRLRAGAEARWRGCDGAVGHRRYSAVAQCRVAGTSARARLERVEGAVRARMWRRACGGVHVAARVWWRACGTVRGRSARRGWRRAAGVAERREAAAGGVWARGRSAAMVVGRRRALRRRPMGGGGAQSPWARAWPGP